MKTLQSILLAIAILFSQAAETEYTAAPRPVPSQPSYTGEKEITVCSWNIKRCPKNQNTKAEIQAITGIVQNESIDILILQEIAADGDFLDSLQERLGSSWYYFSSRDYALRKPYTDKNGQQYKSCQPGDRLDNAVFYNSAEIAARDLSSDYNLDNFASCKYKTDKNIMQFIRFDTGNAQTKLYVVNTHLPFNDKEHRARDLKQAVKFCNDIEGSSHLKIIAGDFNYKNTEIEKYTSGYTVAINEPTTLSSKKNSFASNYDHFIYNDNVSAAISSEPKRLASLNGTKISLGSYEIKDPKGKSSSITYYRNNISDHVPVIMTITIP